jgi:colicin import membrane protein
MSSVKELVLSFGNRGKWDAAVAKVPKTSPVQDPGIGAGCDKILALGKAVRWERVMPADAIKGKAKPEQLADEQFWKGARAEVEGEYKKLDAIAKEIDAQAKRAKAVFDLYGKKPTAYLPVLQYVKVVMAEGPKVGAAVAAAKKQDLAGLDKLFAAAADAKGSAAQADMKADEQRIREAGAARLAAAGAVVALEKEVKAAVALAEKAKAAAAGKKPEAAALVAQGKKAVEGAVPAMKKASVERSELETALKALAAEPFAAAMQAAGKQELATGQKVAAELKAKQEAAEKVLGAVRRELEGVGRGR